MSKASRNPANKIIGYELIGTEDGRCKEIAIHAMASPERLVQIQTTVSGTITRLFEITLDRDLNSFIEVCRAESMIGESEIEMPPSSFRSVVFGCLFAGWRGYCSYAKRNDITLPIDKAEQAGGTEGVIALAKHMPHGLSDMIGESFEVNKKNFFIVDATRLLSALLESMKHGWNGAHQYAKDHPR